MDGAALRTLRLALVGAVEEFPFSAGTSVFLANCPRMTPAFRGNARAEGAARVSGQGQAPT